MTDALLLAARAGLVLERVLARLEGRLLCCAWHAGGTSLAVSGTSGNIHLLDATTGGACTRATRMCLLVYRYWAFVGIGPRSLAVYTYLRPIGGGLAPLAASRPAFR